MLRYTMLQTIVCEAESGELAGGVKRRNFSSIYFRRNDSGRLGQYLGSSQQWPPGGLFLAEHLERIVVVQLVIAVPGLVSLGRLAFFFAVPASGGLKRLCLGIALRWA